MANSDPSTPVFVPPFIPVSIMRYRAFKSSRGNNKYKGILRLLEAMYVIISNVYYF